MTAIAGLTRRYTFQFTPLREGRHRGGGRRKRSGDFNSRPSARGDTPAAQTSKQKSISIHAPPRGATSRSDVDAACRHISIHAPPRGATSCVLLPQTRSPFQFTPLREGRLKVFLSVPLPLHFNSRPSARGDLRCDFSPFELCSISIHAPPRGATRRRIYGERRAVLFQFTPLREGRRWRGAPGIARENFNSRPSARGDAKGFIIVSPHITISIHAPPRGATRRRHARAQVLPISIHAPPRGATSNCHCRCKTVLPFQFTPLREGRRGRRGAGRWRRRISIHAPPRGATSSLL